MPRLLLFLLPLLAVAAAAAAAAGEPNKPTAYEILESYDFPVGILPKGVTSYTLDESTGDFTVKLDTGSSSSSATCDFAIQGSYSLRYDATITGRISADRLTALRGVSVKVLFFWLSIVEVTRRGDQLEFSVGILSADFGVENFLESPQCGCGFDCDNGGGGISSSLLPPPLVEPSLRGAF
uniref:Peptidase A1 domain-containing protein n=1 Tax=Leersia perrieri TaxID=77586 RepID=A0A0D9WFM9_9ORYZ